MRIPSGTTDQYIYFVAVDATDFSSRETGLSSFTVYRSRNGAAAAVMTTPTINETDATNMPGVYELLLDEDMTIGSGNDTEEMVFHITHAGMAPVTRTIELYRPKITVGNTLGVASDGDLLEVNTLTGHTAQTGDSFARLGAPAGASVSADIAAIEAQTDDIGVAGAGLTAIPWNAAWDTEVQSEVADALAVYDPPTKAELDAGFAALNDPTAAAVADAVWDEVLADHTTAGTVGKAITDIEADTNELQGDWVNGGRLDLLIDQIITDIAALNDLSAAQVNAEVLDVLNTDTFTEPSGVPAATATLATKLGYLYMALRNRVDVTATKKTFYDDGGAAEWEKDLSDDGTTYSESEGNAI